MREREREGGWERVGRSKSGQGERARRERQRDSE